MARRGLAGLAFGVAACALLALGLGLGRGLGAGAYAGVVLACAVMPALLGLALWQSPRGNGAPEGSEGAWDALLLRLAERRGGSLTVAEAMDAADLTHAQAERRLERFCARGIAEHRVSNDGVIIYRFQLTPGIHEAS